MLSELFDKGGKLGSIDSLLKGFRNCPATRQLETAHSSHSSRGLVLSQEDKPKRPVRFRHSPFKCARDKSG